MSRLSRFTNIFRTSRLDRDLQEEQAFHLEARTNELARAGLSLDEAAAEARRQFGNPLRLREDSRDARLMPRLESLLQDVRFGLRMLAKDRTVTTAAVLSLALAIGACTAAFSLIEALILRPLPVPDPHRLVYITNPALPDDPRENDYYSYLLFDRFRQAARPQADLFALTSARAVRAAFDDGGGEEEKLRADWVSGDALGILGIRPELGRLLTAADDRRPGQHPVAVLSYSFWMRRFGGSPSVLGKWFTLRGTRLHIVGVAQKGFTGTEPGLRTDVWIPIMMREPRAFTSPNYTWFRVWARLKPGATPEQARQALQAAYIHFTRETASDSRPEVVAYRLRTSLRLRSAANGPSFLRQDFERPLWILAVLVALVLLISCSNIASLLVGRAAARSREMAMRISIGAGRGRLVQQMLTESALLAAAACVLGMGLARVGAPAIARMLAVFGDPAYLELHFGWQATAFVGAVGVLVTLLFGLAPALRASAVAPDTALKQGGKGSPRIVLLRPLLATQVAFSFVVLFSAGLLLSSFQKLTTLDLGFNHSGVVVLGIGGKPHATQPELLANVRQLAGVQAAGLSNWRFFGNDTWTETVSAPGRPRDYATHALEVSPGFFDTMRIGLVEGRDFLPADQRDGSASVIVNQAFARRYLPGRNALGQRFAILRRGQEVPRLIVGVVRDARYNDVRTPPPPTIYYPFSGLNGASLAVRTAADPAAFVAAFRDGMRRMDAGLRITDITLQSTLVENKLLRERLLALLSGFFALVALALAAIGLYGVLNYSVVRRTREIGIRVALGARRGAVVRLIVSEVALVTAMGLAAGAAAGLALSRWVVALLYEVKPSDAASLALPLVLLLAACIMAVAAPAARAARIDPLVALRYE